MKKVAQINYYEEKELRELYDAANKTNKTKEVQAIQDFYNVLGKKYKFDPTETTINTKGEVFQYNLNKKYKVTISYVEGDDKAIVDTLDIRPFDVRRVKDFLKELRKDIQ